MCRGPEMSACGKRTNLSAVHIRARKRETLLLAGKAGWMQHATNTLITRSTFLHHALHTHIRPPRLGKHLTVQSTTPNLLTMFQYKTLTNNTTHGRDDLSIQCAGRIVDVHTSYIQCYHFKLSSVYPLI